MYVVIAPGRIAEDISEDEMLDASDRFQHEFVDHQRGVRRRLLVAGDDGRYADIVFFDDEAAIAELLATEQESEVCHRFMAMWADATVGVHRVLRLHERP